MNGDDLKLNFKNRNLKDINTVNKLDSNLNSSSNTNEVLSMYLEDSSLSIEDILTKYSTDRIVGLSTDKIHENIRNIWAKYYKR